MCDNLNNFIDSILDKYNKQCGGNNKNKNNKKDNGNTNNKKKFKCIPTNPFKDICKEDDIGKYKTKESCVNDCENMYIYDNLYKAGIIYETKIYHNFIKELLDQNIEVYLKGGNPLGLCILKLIYNKYPDDINFKKYFEKFLELELVKDWDFHCYTNKEIDIEYRKKLDVIAEKYHLVSRGGKKLVLYQTKKPIQIYETALFELSLWEKDNYSDLESVMSTMKVKVTKYNLKYIFMFAKSFYSYKIKKEQIDVDIIKRMIQKIDIIIYPHSNGFFRTDQKTFNDGGLSPELLEFIHKYKTYDYHIVQFLIAHTKEPKRMYLRLLLKNLPKAKKIYNFLSKETNVINTIPNWLLDDKKIMKVINQFTEELSDAIVGVYIKKNIDSVFMFLRNVNFKPLKDEYEKFPKEGMEFTRILLKGFYDKIKDNLDKYDNNPNDTGNLIKVLKFLGSKKVFD